MTETLIKLALFVSAIGFALSVLPPDPLADAVVSWENFVTLEVVGQGLSWLAWFMPVGSVVSVIPAIANGIFAFYGVRFLLGMFEFL